MFLARQTFPPVLWQWLAKCWWPDAQSISCVALLLKVVTYKGCPTVQYWYLPSLHEMSFSMMWLLRLYLDAVLLQHVQVLTLYKGRYTTARRSSPVPQLQCVGGSAGCHAFVPEVVQCQNKGWDGMDVQVRFLSAFRRGILLNETNTRNRGGVVDCWTNPPQSTRLWTPNIFK